MWLPRQDSNLKPRGSEPRALPVELHGIELAQTAGFEPASDRLTAGRVTITPHLNDGRPARS